MASRKARTTGPVETANPLKRMNSKAYGDESSGSAAVIVFSPVGNYAFAVRVDVPVGATPEFIGDAVPYCKTSIEIAGQA
jgi:hypothetical protein